MGCFCDEELVEFLEFLPGECLRGQVVPGMQNAIVLHIRTRDDEGSVPDLFFFPLYVFRVLLPSLVSILSNTGGEMRTRFAAGEF